MLQKNAQGGYDRVEPPTPKPTGQTLLELDRSGKTMRVSLETYEGSKFVGLRVWQDGLPTKSGTSLRLSEIPALIQALERIYQTEGSATQSRPARDRPQSRPNLRDPRPEFVDKRRRTQVVPSERRESFPTPRSSARPFDELGQE